MIKQDMTYICNYYFNNFHLSYVNLRQSVNTAYLSLNLNPYLGLGPFPLSILRNPSNKLSNNLLGNIVKVCKYDEQKVFK